MVYGMRIDEIELSNDTERTHKFMRTISILMKGGKLSIPNTNYHLALAKMENDNVMPIMITDTGKVLGIDESFSYIFSLINTIDEDEITIGMANNVLNSFIKRR
jgi:hypothetical protein